MRITVALLAFLLIVFIAIVYFSLSGYSNLPQKLSGYATLVALIVTIYTVFQNIVLSRFLQDFIGLEQYTYEAAKRYIRAKQRVLGVVGHWQVSSMLEFALTNCECEEIIFIGKIEMNETLPGVIWRLSLNAERKKRKLPPMKIYHVDRASLLFVVIDDKTVLIEHILRGRSVGRVFDDSPDLATDYATTFDTFYQRNETAESKIIELLYNFVKQRFPATKVELNEVENNLLDVTNFKRKKENKRYIGEDRFRVMLQHYINKIVKKYPNEFNLSGENGQFVIEILK
jgi:hypothetical protein